MRFDEYRKQDATALAGLIAKGEVSAKDVLETAIARAEQVNPAINAIVHKQYEKARKAVAAGRAGRAAGRRALSHQGPGLPRDGRAGKARQQPVQGLRRRSRQRLRHALQEGRAWSSCGRSSTPEFGLNPTTEPRLNGPCRNPWNLEHSAGGSSGGAAAAVIAGVLPVAHATDGGGSIRIPAAQCGLFGLKPSRGRMSLAPDAGEGWGGLSVGHVVSRSVRDSALMLDCTAGAEPGDPYAAPTPKGSFIDALGRPPGKLRIALMLKDHRGAQLHPECEKAVQGAAKLCASLGHSVEEADPKLDLVALRPMNARIAAANTARGVRACAGRHWGASLTPKDVEAATWAVYQRGLKVSGIEYVEAIASAHAMGRKMGAFLGSYDIILSTVLAGPPPKLGYFDQNSNDVETFAERVNTYLSVTPLHNATGTPAMSVPLHWTADGLPVGVHFAGRYGEEATLLQLAAQLEQAQPWFDRVPAL